MNFEYISGPVSWVGFESQGKAFHFFGDQHGSKEKNCESAGLKCSSIIEKVKDADCYSIDYLIERIFIHSEVNQQHADLFLEAYYQPKKSSKERMKIEREGYIKEIYNYFLDQVIKLDEEKNQKLNFAKQHYIDIRFSSEKCISIYDIFEDLLSSMLSDLTIENSGDFMRLAENIFFFIKYKENIFNSGDLEKTIQKVLSESEDWYEDNDDNEEIVSYLNIFDERVMDLKNFYKEKEGKKLGFYYYEFESLKNKKLVFEDKDVHKILERFIDEKIKTYFDDFRSRIFSIDFGYNDWRNKPPEEVYEIAKKFIGELAKTFLMIGVLVVDGFTLAKMMKSLKSGPQIMIVYAGQFHTLNYMEFFSDFLGLNIIDNPIFSESRCIKNPNFGKIFQPWMVS